MVFLHCKQKKKYDRSRGWAREHFTFDQSSVLSGFESDHQDSSFLQLVGNLNKMKREILNKCQSHVGKSLIGICSASCSKTYRCFGVYSRFECSIYVQLFEVAIPFSVRWFIGLKNSHPNVMHPLNTKSYAAVITTFTQNYPIVLGYILIHVLDMNFFYACPFEIWLCTHTHSLVFFLSQEFIDCLPYQKTKYFYVCLQNFWEAISLCSLIVEIKNDADNFMLAGSLPLLQEGCWLAAI